MTSCISVFMEISCILLKACLITNTDIFENVPLDVAPEVLALILILGGKSGGAPWWGDERPLSLSRGQGLFRLITGDFWPIFSGMGGFFGGCGLKKSFQSGWKTLGEGEVRSLAFKKLRFLLMFQ